MKKVLISLAYDKQVVGDYLVPLNLRGKYFVEWAVKLLQQKEILQQDFVLTRVIVKTGNQRNDFRLDETLGSVGVKEGSLISIL